VLGIFLLWPSAGRDLEWDELLREDAVALAVPAQPAKKMTLLATDAVQVFVRDKETRQKIFSGTMRKGGSEEFECHGNVQIAFSEGDALTIRRESGETLRPNKSGGGSMDVAY
jgi:hypothetical protein